MTEELSLKLDQDLLKQLDKRRGDLNRSEFILLILTEHLNNAGRVKFKKMNSTDSNTESQDISPDMAFLIGTLQEFAKDIYNRLDRLEDIINSNPEEISNTNSLVDDQSNHGKEKGLNEPDNSFSFTEKETSGNKDTVVFKVSDEDYLEVDPDQSGNLENSEFEYGCPFCNATIPENATKCPKCGKIFDDIENNTLGASAAEVKPISEGYTNKGNYDPRPSYLKRESPEHFASQDEPDKYPDRPQVRFKPIPNESRKNPPLCQYCGRVLSYIDDYKRWFCYRCKKYFGGSPPRSRAVEVSPIRMQSEPEPAQGYVDYPSTETEPKRAKKPNYRPLKEYHRYTD
jgi:ribosomal protein L37AE/L43A